MLQLPARMLRSLSPGFESGVVERAFVQTRSDILLRNTGVLGAMMCVGCALIGLSNVASQLDELGGHYDSSSPYIMQIFSMLSVSAVSGLTSAVMLCSRGRLRAFLRRYVEHIIFVSMVFSLVAVIPDGAFLQSLNADTDQDSTITQPEKIWVVSKALGLDAMITVSHFAVPIRWILMVWIDLSFVLGFVVYSLVIFRASPNHSEIRDLTVENVVTYTAIFATLVLGSLVGLHRQEVSDRKNFDTIASERTMRVQAEFQVARRSPQASEASPSNGRPESSVGAKSTLTTATGELFEDIDLSDPGTLSKLRDLGRGEEWLLDPSEVTIHEDLELGRGGFGRVVVGTFCKGDVAIKRYTGDSCRAKIALINELRVMRRVRHPNVALFHGAIVGAGDDDVVLVLELIRGRSLNEAVMQLEAWKKSSPKARFQADIMLQTCQALVFLHSRSPRIVHADVKPSNIMVCQVGRRLCPKLMDFGCARRMTKNVKPTGGTPGYIPPERMQSLHAKPSTAGDIYALGHLLFLMASGRRPHAAYDPKQILQLMRGGTVPRLAFSPSTALLSAWQDAIEECTRVDPSQRPSAAQLCDAIGSRCGPRTPGDYPRGCEEDFARGRQQGEQDPEQLPEQAPEPSPPVLGVRLSF